MNKVQIMKIVYNYLIEMDSIYINTSTNSIMFNIEDIRSGEYNMYSYVEPEIYFLPNGDIVIKNPIEEQVEYLELVNNEVKVTAYNHSFL